MSLTRSIQRGINSSTYNPEAEKALQEERKKASEAKQKYRQGLFTLRDTKAQMVQKKEATEYFILNVDKLADDGFKWITANPEADVQQITDQATLTTEMYQDYLKANAVLLGLFVLPTFFKTVASDAFLKKQIKEDKKAEIDAFADGLDKWLKTSKNATAEQILAKQQEIQVDSQKLLEGTGKSVPAVTNSAQASAVEKQVAKTQEVVKKEEEADRNTFKLSRLFKETYSIAVKVVGSLFIVMLILVSGMLTANDAIGRDPQYRILYFIYGGIGFPIMLIYYLYRWFLGTAPHIYRLLPIFTEQSDTTLGRFFLFPFTYKEDPNAIDAKTAFMTEAAELVGKKYTAPATAEAVANAVASGAKTVANNLSGLVEGIQRLAINAGDPMRKGANTILAGLQKIELPK